jgi:hypothetical protein
MRDSANLKNLINFISLKLDKKWESCDLYFSYSPSMFRHSHAK